MTNDTPNAARTTRDQKLRHFVEVAEAYCSLIERHGRYERMRFVRRCAALLGRLYAAALELPKGRLSSRMSVRQDETVDARRARASELRDSLRGHLGQIDDFWVIYCPYEQEDGVQTSHSDALTDIWSDLKPGLRLFAEGTTTAQRHAIASWRLHLHSHWGRHLTEALNAMEWIISKEAED